MISFAILHRLLMECFRFTQILLFSYSKTLLKALDDIEQSSAVGSAVVLKNFIRLKGSELFHAIPELVHDSLAVSEAT